MYYPLLAADPIVHVNATLNAVAALLLVAGLVLIKRGRVTAHKRIMMSAFVVSVAFLACYLYYHIRERHVAFTHPGPVKYVYYTVLATHIPLAITVPFLAVAQIYLGFRALGCCSTGRNTAEQLSATAVFGERHRRLARWTMPIWMYVSVTGVIVYVMLYHLWPPAA
jgi:uncharacterized membrane protein YozB (DUF420 family)